MSHYNLYESLGLSRQASSEELAQKLDSRLSDLRKQGKEDSAPEVEEVATARRILGDSDLRRVHDSRLDDPSAPDIDIPALRELAASAGIAGAARHSATPDPEKTTKLNSEAGSSRVSAPYSQPSNPGSGSGYRPQQGQSNSYGGWSSNGNGAPNQQPYGGYPQNQPQEPQQGSGFVQRVAEAAGSDRSLKGAFAKMPTLPKVASIVALAASALFSLAVIVVPFFVKSRVVDSISSAGSRLRGDFVYDFLDDMVDDFGFSAVSSVLGSSAEMIVVPFAFVVCALLVFQALRAVSVLLAPSGEGPQWMLAASYVVVVLGALAAIFSFPFGVSWTALVVLLYAVAMIVLLLLPDSLAWAKGKKTAKSNQQNNQFGSGQAGYGQPQQYGQQYNQQQGW